MPEQPSIVVVCNPTSIATRCPTCDTWHEVGLKKGAARRIALQLLMQADRIPVEALWPTITEANR